MEDDLRKLGVKRWRTKALNREEWVSIIREAKAKLKGRSAIGRRRKYRILVVFDGHWRFVSETRTLNLISPRTVYFVNAL